MFVLTGTDRLNHYLWEDYEDTSSPFHQTFLDYYHEVDNQIGRILERLDDRVTIAAVSDHGFARQRMSVKNAPVLKKEPAHSLCWPVSGLTALLFYRLPKRVFKTRSVAGDES